MSVYAFLFFVVGPLVEIASIVLVAHLVGWWTLVALAASAVLGSYVLRTTGRDWMNRLQAQSSGQPSSSPRPAVGDSAMRFTAGILLISPGFVSDVIGLLLLLPFVRMLLRGAVASWFVRRFTAVTGPGGFTVWSRRGFPGDRDGPQVIKGEVIREDVPPESLEP